MDTESVFNRYDIRGDYPEEIDEAFAERMGRAVGTFAAREGRGRVVVGRDGRSSSQAIYPRFIEGLRASGANVVDIGEGPTDRVALAASHYGGTGVMVTASHHAWSRTGFKLVYEKGHGFSNEDMEGVKRLFREQDFETGDGNLLQEETEFTEEYIEGVLRGLDDAPRRVDGRRIAVDTSGSAGPLAATVFDEAGADVTRFERTEHPAPEPGEDERERFAEFVLEHDVDLGVGFDPDGDRVYVIHPEMGWIDGDRILYLLIRVLESETVVASIDTSPLIEEADADVEYSKVGDVFVAEKGVEEGADLLGEPNGHYAVTDFCWYNSGLFSSLIVAASADRIPSVLKEVEGHSTLRTSSKYGSRAEMEDALEQVKKNIAREYTVTSRLDGVRFEGDGFTGLVRPSGTSPTIRAAIHSSDRDRCKEILDGILP